MSDKVILVEINDKIIGEIAKIEAHEKALLHRAVSVIIFNSKGQMLLQKRALNKYHSAGLWSNTACTHPFPGEDNKTAAQRRLKEEMGIHAEVFKIFDFIYHEKLDNGLTEHEFDHVYIGISDEPPQPDPNEVSDFDYFERNFLKNELSSSPKHYTVWFAILFDRVYDFIDQQHLRERLITYNQTS